jgi:hypothetical protein
MVTLFAYGNAVNAWFENKVVNSSSASSFDLIETSSMESSGVNGGVASP